MAPLFGSTYPAPAATIWQRTRDGGTTCGLNADWRADFPLGYYHQRAALRAGRLPQLPETEPDLEVHYELRMDADLKSWIKANGGDKLVRALLRDARTRHEA
jgi:hypothetical protein